MSWKTLRDVWLPAVVTTLIGVGLGWLVSYKDTQTQIHSLQDANQKLQEQYGILKDQNQMLVSQGETLGKQTVALTTILRNVAAASHDVHLLALDRHGNITLEGKAIVDSGGRLLTDASGNAITTESGIPISIGSQPPHH